MRPTTIDQPLTSIPPVVDAVLRPINGVLTFVLSIIEATIRSLTDAIPAFFTEVLLVLNAISGVVHGIVSALDACVDPGREHHGQSRLLFGFVAAILFAVALVAAGHPFFLAAVLAVIFAISAILLPIVTIVLTPLHSLGGCQDE